MTVSAPDCTTVLLRGVSSGSVVTTEEMLVSIDVILSILSEFRFRGVVDSDNATELEILGWDSGPISRSEFAI